MKTALLAASILVFSTFSYAQGFGDQGTIFLKGNIKNFKSKYFEFAQTGFLKNESSSLMVDDKGDFAHRFIIEGKRQDCYLYLNNDAITFTVEDGDTIYMNWDHNRFRETFQISNTKKDRNDALGIQWLQYLKFRGPFEKLGDELYGKRKSLSSQDKFALVNALFKQEFALLAKMAHQCNESVFYSSYLDVYFKYVNVLRSENLLSVSTLNTDTELLNDQISKEQNERLKDFVKQIHYKGLRDQWFWMSDQYREFLYNYPRLSGLFNSFSGITDEFDPTLRNYYRAKAEIPVKSIREWFISKNILDDFNWYKFKNVEQVYLQFSQELSDSTLKRSLNRGYQAAATLKPGNVAPEFTLKDDEGNSVSLSQFKGKVVYLDFWGVGCGPCIYDIENYGKKFHERYKGKDIVFVSVCVDANEKQWKSALVKYKMEDQVNLIAEGWTEHPVCRLYNIAGIPHYFLIGKDGRIINNNASHMGELLGQQQNEIDKAL